MIAEDSSVNWRTQLMHNYVCMCVCSILWQDSCH